LSLQVGFDRPDKVDHEQGGHGVLLAELDWSVSRKPRQRDCPLPGRRLSGRVTAWPDMDSRWTVARAMVVLMQTSNQPGAQWDVEIPPGLCRRCMRALSRGLRDLPGVVAFEIDATAGRVRISGDVDHGAAEAVVRDLSCS
jgi:hypothetical protein